MALANAIGAEGGIRRAGRRAPWFEPEPAGRPTWTLTGGLVVESIWVRRRRAMWGPSQRIDCSMGAQVFDSVRFGGRLCRFRRGMDVGVMAALVWASGSA